MGIRKKMSLRRLAEKLGCNVSTVSRALRSKTGVSPAKILEIQKAARESGISGRLRTRILQLVIFPPERGIDFYSLAIFNAVRAEAGARNYSLSILPAGDFSRLNYAARGTVIIDFSEENSRRLMEKGVYPLVRINNRPSHLDNLFTVRSDDIQAMELLVREFTQYGHTRLGMIYPGPAGFYTNMKRGKAFLDMIAKYELDPESAGFMAAMDDSSNHFSCAQVLLRFLKAGVTGLIIGGEDYSLEISCILNETGIRVPEDLSAAGWEVPGVSPWLLGGLTTVSQNFSMLASKAIDVLEEQAAGKTPPGGDVLVDYTLIPRRSIAYFKTRHPSGSRPDRHRN